MDNIASSPEGESPKDNDGGGKPRAGRLFVVDGQLVKESGRR